MKWGPAFCAGMVLFCLLCTGASGYTVTLEPRITVSSQYTDNVFLNAQDPKGDFITTFTPGFTAQLFSRNMGAEVSYDPGYAVYADFNENNNWRDSANLRAWAELSEDSMLEISDTFLRTEDPLAWKEIEFMREEAVTIGEAPTVRKGREPYINNRANITFSHDFGVYSNLEIGYTHRLLDNDDPTIVSNQSHNPFFNLAYRPTVRFGIVPHVEYLRATYDDNIGDFSNWLGALRLEYKFTRHLEGFFQYAHTTRDYDSQNIVFEDFHVFDPSVGVGYQLSRAFSLNGWAGYFLQDNDESKDLGGYYVGGDLTWEAERQKISLEASNGYERADLGTQRLGLTRFVRVRATGAYDFTRHFSGQVSAYYRENEYMQTIDDRKDRYYGGRAWVEYQIFKWMFVSLEYGHNRVVSTEARQEYTENRGLLRVTLAPDEPWRWIF